MDYVSSSGSESDDEVDDQVQVLNARSLIETRNKRFKTASVDKEDDLVYDVGSLACFDGHEVDVEQFKQQKDDYLREAARDNTQLLFNQIFSQPALRNTEGVFAELPFPSTELPREKPLPKPKMKTKWDEFAQVKGIEKRKRSGMVWNEEMEEFVPRYGKKSAKNNKMQDWLMELPDDAKDAEAPFLEKRKDKKKAILKQKKQELANRNRAKQKGMKKMPGSASVALLTGGKKLDRKQLKQTINEQMIVTKKGTASAGVFANTIQNEPKMKKVKAKRTSNAYSSDEKEKQNKVLDRILAKESKDTLIIEKAIKQHGGNIKEKRGGGDRKGKKRGRK